MTNQEQPDTRPRCGYPWQEGSGVLCSREAGHEDDYHSHRDGVDHTGDFALICPVCGNHGAPAAPGDGALPPDARGEA